MTSWLVVAFTLALIIIALALVRVLRQPRSVAPTTRVPELEADVFRPLSDVIVEAEQRAVNADRPLPDYGDDWNRRIRHLPANDLSWNAGAGGFVFTCHVCGHKSEPLYPAANAEIAGIAHYREHQRGQLQHRASLN